MGVRTGLIWTVVAAGLAVGPAQAAPCGGAFGPWLAAFKQEAAAKGISQRTIAAALDGVTPNPEVIRRDRGQGVFGQSFLEFSNRMVAGYRLQQGAAKLAQHRGVFQEIEQRYGVPGPVLVAFWGLETDFGAVMGNLPTIRSLATLAHDCRRSEEFQEQLVAALQVIDRGDLAPGEMVGPFAGELGQMQFLPTVYVEHAVDFDGDGRRNLIRSAPDVLASSAAYIASLGWRRGEPWLQEVDVPASLPWDQADLAIRHPRSQWAAWGVRQAGGQPLAADGLQASLLLPMGRNGPAFLAYPNFHQVYLTWNKSLVYSTTAAYFATRLAGAGPVGRGSAGEALSMAQVKELQTLLARQGFEVGKIDGIPGAGTRAAVKAMQIELGMPADSYPTAELLQRLRGR